MPTTEVIAITRPKRRRIIPRTAARAKPERGGQINGDDVFPVLVAQLHEKVISGHAGIGDENIELAHGLLGARHQRLGFDRIGEIARHDMDAFAEFGRELIEDFPPRSGNGEGCALAVEGAGDGAADGAGGPGNQRGLSGKLEHLAPGSQDQQ